MGTACFAAVAGLTMVPAVAMASADQFRQADVLSAEDRELVRLVVELSAQERAGWTAELAVLLDSTRPMCDASPVRGCLGSAVLDDLSSPAALALMTPDCSRVDYSGLRAAFVARNGRSLRLDDTRASLPTVSGAEVRAMSTDEKSDRFGERWLVEVSAPAYSRDGRSAIVYVYAAPALEGSWASIRVFERRDGRWAPTRCGLNLTP